MLQLVSFAMEKNLIISKRVKQHREATYISSSNGLSGHSRTQKTSLSKYLFKGQNIIDPIVLSGRVTSETLSEQRPPPASRTVCPSPLSPSGLRAFHSALCAPLCLSDLLTSLTCSHKHTPASGPVRGRCQKRVSSGPRALPTHFQITVSTLL